MNQKSISNKIDIASNIIGKTWPLYAFVTSNPLAGYENTHFQKAVKEAQNMTSSNLYPGVSLFKAAWQKGEIDEKELKSLFSEYNINCTPEESLQKIEVMTSERIENSNQELDRIVVKWLMAFLDEGLAEWQMPKKEQGFFKAWRSLAAYDKQIRNNAVAHIPKNSTEALSSILKEYPENQHLDIIKYHISALPGWTGYIKYRTEENSVWQQKFKITLEEYLAVRLSIAKLIDAHILPEKVKVSKHHSLNDIQYLWLKAWERSFQNKLTQQLDDELENNKDGTDKIPDAQMVFCIDTRSELIRRHVESKGDYETFGYAGFFGIAMDYQNMKDGLDIKSCPPILNSAYKVSETPKRDKTYELIQYQEKQDKLKFKDYFLKRMKNMLPSAFGYVEGSGVFYGISLLMQTLVPQYLYNSKRKEQQSYESICNPHINSIKANTTTHHISLEEKVAIVKSAFNLTGWSQFSPLVLFVGHGSHSKNNPFASSLDCGACAASPGRHNARMLAKLANEKEVRTVLINDGFQIPDETYFIGAEHNTTTDEIVLFDADVPNYQQINLAKLKQDLALAQETATQERLAKDKNSILTAYQKTNDWSETRPEWGLAKNNAFIIGSRTLTKNLNLKGHCFLHSYDWKLDGLGQALEGIMQGPMVVTQWINNHYYFSSVDNNNYGGGSKIFHNITGKFGVVLGNGSDLKTGLPLQSVNETDEKMYHQPLRLSVYIHAPKDRIQHILENNDKLKSLLDHEWIYLLAIDPTEKNMTYRYEKSMEWEMVSESSLTSAPLSHQ